MRLLKKDVNLPFIYISRTVYLLENWKLSGIAAGIDCKQ